MTFTETTELCERSLRRLAQSKGCDIQRSGDTYTCCGVEMTDDEVWSLLNSL